MCYDFGHICFRDQLDSSKVQYNIAFNAKRKVHPDVNDKLYE